jgi:hypothetical protein
MWTSELSCWNSLGIIKKRGSKQSRADLSLYRVERTTNNENESYHACLRRIFLAKPGIWCWVKKMNAEMKVDTLNMERLDNGLPLSRPQKRKTVFNQNRRRQSWDKLDRGLYTSIEFVFAAAYTLPDCEDDGEEPDVEEEHDGDGHDGDMQVDPLDVAQPQQDNGGRRCIICFEMRTPPHHILTPCGHGHCCSLCQLTLIAQEDPCPECRQVITGRMQAFLD